MVVLLTACQTKSVESYVETSDQLIKDSKIQEAIVNYQKGIKDHPREAVLYINQAALFRDQQMYPHAIRNYETIKKLNPDSFWAYVGLSRIYILQKKHEKAKKVLQEGLKKSPKNPSILFHLGRVSYEMGFGEEALTYFDEALDAKYKFIHKIYLYRAMTFENLMNNKERAKMDYESYLMSEHDGDKEAIRLKIEGLGEKKFEF